MNFLLVRYQFQDPNPVKSSDLVDLLKQNYGAGVSFIADGTITIDSAQSPDVVFDLLAPLFTFDDKLFIGRINDFRSMHHISAPKFTKVAI